MAIRRDFPVNYSRGSVKRDEVGNCAVGIAPTGSIAAVVAEAWAAEGLFPVFSVSSVERAKLSTGAAGSGVEAMILASAVVILRVMRVIAIGAAL